MSVCVCFLCVLSLFVASLLFCSWSHFSYCSVCLCVESEFCIINQMANAVMAKHWNAQRFYKHSIALNRLILFMQIEIECNFSLIENLIEFYAQLFAGLDQIYVSASAVHRFHTTHSHIYTQFNWFSAIYLSLRQLDVSFVIHDFCSVDFYYNVWNICVMNICERCRVHSVTTVGNSPIFFSLFGFHSI